MPAPNFDTIRPELDPENTRKVRAWEAQLRERYGVTMSPQRIVNLLIAGIEFFDIEQTLKIGLSEPEPSSDRGQKKKRLIVRTTLGKTL